MNEYTPYVGPHDEVLQQTGLRYAINKAMHNLTADQLAEVVAFIAGFETEKPKAVDYQQGAYTVAYTDAKKGEPVEPFRGVDRWLHVV